MKKIYIYCDGGFGNRYTTLIGGLQIAKWADLAPQIIWPQNNWCGAAFANLFESKLAVIDFDHTTFFQTHATTNIIHENQFNQNLFYRHPNSFTRNEILDFIAASGNDIFYFNNSLATFCDKRDLIDNIIPSLEFHSTINHRVQEILHTIDGKDYVGVHLRKTDFVPSFDEKIIRDAVENNPEIKFFICSDDKETEESYQQFPNVFVHPKQSYAEKLLPGDWNHIIVDSLGNSFPFNVKRSESSVIAAIVDLILLSRSQLLSTDRRSSFLQIAYLLQGAE